MRRRVVLAVLTACVLGACAGRETELTSPCLGPGAPTLPGDEPIVASLLERDAAAEGTVVIGDPAAIEAARAAGLLDVLAPEIDATTDGMEGRPISEGTDVTAGGGVATAYDAPLAASAGAPIKGCDFTVLGAS